MTDITTDIKSILYATVEELKEIITSNQLPEHINLSGLETRDDFAKLFSHRFNPKLIARVLLDELTRQTNENSPKNLRLQLKQKELELKEKKISSQTQQLNNIYRKLQDIEAVQKTILALLAGKGG